ncbi:MAG TPA: hypothetical protein VFY26_06660 [Anaerolineales bacterium]|nr:hypothetical protein [Anaerolineales bacterium]
MPKVKMHPMFIEIQGKLYGMVVKLSPQGELIIAKRPDMSKVKWSKAQKAHRKRFKLATAYAKEALAVPKIRRTYERRAKKLDKTPWGLAVSDYFKGENLLAKG